MIESKAECDEDEPQESKHSDEDISTRVLTEKEQANKVRRVEKKYLKQAADWKSEMQGVVKETGKRAA